MTQLSKQPKSELIRAQVVDNSILCNCSGVGREFKHTVVPEEDDGKWKFEVLTSHQCCAVKL